MNALQDARLYLAGAAVALVAILPFDDGFYTFVRLSVTAVSALAAYELKKKDHGMWIAFLLMAILYNPLMPINLNDKEPWVVINLATAIAFVWVYREVKPGKLWLNLVLEITSKLSILAGIGFSVWLILETYSKWSVENQILWVVIFLGVSAGLAFIINKIFFNQSTIWLTREKMSENDSMPNQGDDPE